MYNVQFSFQFHGLSGGGNGTTAQVWLDKNGTAVPHSNTLVTVNNNSPYVVAAWNFMFDLNANDYFELMWASDDLDVIMLSAAATGFHPSIPSVILTVSNNIKA